MRKKLERAVILMPPRDLAGCWVAVVAELARMAGVELPGCTDPECEHARVPDGFTSRWPRGMYVAQAIADIERYVGGPDNGS